MMVGNNFHLSYQSRFRLQKTPHFTSPTHSLSSHSHFPSTYFRTQRLTSQQHYYYSSDWNTLLKRHSSPPKLRTEIYTTGRGTEGQLGNGKTESSPFPNFVPSLSQEKMTSLSAGYTHSFALTGSVFDICFMKNMTIVVIRIHRF